jgi:hypothetical protein
MRDMDAAWLPFLLVVLLSDTPAYPVDDLGSNLGGFMYGVGVGGVKAHDWLYCGKDQEKDCGLGWATGFVGLRS